MRQKLTDVFIRAVRIKVQDCSSPMQLRAYLNKYRNYIFSQEISKVFYDRIAFFREEYRHEQLYLEACDDLEDILEFEIKLTAESSFIVTVGPKNHKSEPKTKFRVNLDEISINQFKSIIVKFGGDLRAIALYSNNSIDLVQSKIHQHRLRTFLKHYSMR